MLGLGWQGKDPTGGTLNAWAFYSYAYSQDTAGCPSPQQNEFNLIVSCQPLPVPELSLTLEYAQVHQDEVLGDSGMREVRLMLEWDMDLW